MRSCFFFGTMAVSREQYKTEQKFRSIFSVRSRVDWRPCFRFDCYFDLLGTCGQIDASSLFISSEPKSSRTVLKVFMLFDMFCFKASFLQSATETKLGNGITSIIVLIAQFCTFFWTSCGHCLAFAMSCPAKSQLNFNCGICAKRLSDASALFTSCGHFFCASRSRGCTALVAGSPAGKCEQCGMDCDAGTLGNKAAKYDTRVQDFIFTSVPDELQKLVEILQVRILKSSSCGELSDGTLYLLYRCNN